MSGQISDGPKLKAHPGNYLCWNVPNDPLGVEPSGYRSDSPAGHHLNLYWYGDTNMTSVLRLSYEISVQDRYLVEIQIFEVPKTAAYPLGYRYRLICMDPVTQARILMDNHHPKGPHVHINDQEYGYAFLTPEKLVSDFKDIVLQKMGIVL